jgi:hypothetical protein
MQTQKIFLYSILLPLISNKHTLPSPLVGEGKGEGGVSYQKYFWIKFNFWGKKI